MDCSPRKPLTIALVLVLMIPVLACSLPKPGTPEQKANDDLKYWARRQYQQESTISLDEKNTYDTMIVTSVKKASGESHEIMAQMILMGQGEDSNLDAYSKVELVDVKLPNGEVKTGVKTTSKAKGVEFHLPD